MAEIYGPFDAGIGSNFLESEWSEMFKTLRHDGPAVGFLSDLLVFADNTGMQVKIPSGGAWVRGHWYRTDAQIIKTIAAAHATLPRWDRVILRLDWSANTIVTAVLTGTPNASPTDPALTQNTSIWEISLARIVVDPTVTSIVAGKVIDQRNVGRAYVNTTGEVQLTPVSGQKTSINSNVDILGRASFVTSGLSFVAGSIYRSTTTGLSMGGISGSTSDLLATNNAGLSVWDNPTTTQSMRLFGALLWTPTNNAVLRTDNSAFVDIDYGNVFSTQRFVIRKDAGATELAEINENGFFGLGTVNTFMPWSTAFKVIQLFGTGGLGIAASANTLYAAQNWYFDGTNFRYGSTGNADKLSIGANAYSYDQAVSGTIGNIISWINRVAINSTGGATYTAEGSQYVSALRNSTSTQFSGQIIWDSASTGFLSSRIWSSGYTGTGSLGQAALSADGTAELFSNFPLYIGTSGAQQLVFSTSALTRWQITSSGHLEPFSALNIGSLSAPIEDMWFSATSVLRAVNGMQFTTPTFNGTSSPDLTALGLGIGGFGVQLGDSSAAIGTMIYGLPVRLSAGDDEVQLDGLNAAFRPVSNGVINLGLSANKWNTVYAAVGTINTSHSSVKRSMHKLSPNALLRLARETSLYAFKYKMDKEAFTHIGFKAEDTHRFLSLDGRSSAPASTAAVALGAVVGLGQEIHARITELENEIKRLKSESVN